MTPVHADEVDRAIAAEGREVAEGLGQKGGEGRFVHLARSHREGAMVDRAEPARIPIDRDVVRRVGEHHGSALLTHQGYKIGRVERIATQNAMRPEEPQIAALAEWRPPGRLGYGICGVVSRVGLILE